MSWCEVGEKPNADSGTRTQFVHIVSFICWTDIKQRMLLLHKTTKAENVSEVKQKKFTRHNSPRS